MIAPPSPRSDPENMDLYYNIGSASSPEYRTFRGTSQLEGYHPSFKVDVFWVFNESTAGTYRQGRCCHYASSHSRFYRKSHADHRSGR